MKLGVATVVTDEGVRPDVLAKALENRGFDSLVVAEHSHIPASRATPFPAGGELPREYCRSHDPFAALTAAAVVTSKLLIGPGVIHLPQRETIQAAKAVSSLCQISAGRLHGPGTAEPSRRRNRHASERHCRRTPRTRAPGRLPPARRTARVPPPIYQTRIRNAPAARQPCGTDRNIPLSPAGRRAPRRTARKSRMCNCSNVLKEERDTP
jgi:alkanesulfonate monooxygenase SsuD/methylene tetrahydromethanopterin reductase-like flavin-dependent oxidoreductase (luciferase family)